MQQFKARELASQPFVELTKLPSKFVLVFDDGQIETTQRRVFVSWFFWEYHRQFTDIPIYVSNT